MYGLLNWKMELGRLTFCERVNKGYISTILIAGRTNWIATVDVSSFSRILSHTMNIPSTTARVNFHGSFKISNLDYKNSLLIPICFSSSRLLPNLISHRLLCNRTFLEQWQSVQLFTERPLVNEVQNSETLFKKNTNTAVVGCSVAN